MEDMFQASRFFSPKPPSFLGKQTSSQATLALAKSPPFPFHRNLLNFLLMSLIIFFERMKIQVQ
jgi:hypothetical protein